MSNDRQRQDLETTYIENRNRLCRLAQRIVGTRELAEDVLQCAYLRIAAHPTHEIIEEPVRYWSQVVRHIAIDCRRRINRESQMFANESRGQAVPSGRSSPEQVAMSVQYLSLVEQTLLRFPARTRQAFNLYRLDGLSQREIASRLGVSPSLVSIMIREALDALKQCRQQLDQD